MERKPKRFLLLTRQLHMLIVLGGVLLVALVVLLFLRRRLAYRETVVVSPYDVTQEAAEAGARLLKSDEKARVVTRSARTDYKVQFAFDGMSTPAVMESILTQLAKYDMKAQFFVPGIDAAESETTLREIAARGHTLGNCGMRGETHMEQISSPVLTESLCGASKVMRVNAAYSVSVFKARSTEYTDDLLRCVYACGLTTALDTPYQVDTRSFSSYSSVLRYVNEKPLGSVIAFRISGELDEPIEDEKPAEAKPAVDMQPTLADADKVDMSKLSEEERVMLISEWLIRAAAEADYSRESVALRQKNDGRLCVQEQNIRTVEPAVCFMFASLGQEAELKGLLAALREIDAKGTFFVTLAEAREQEEQIRLLLAEGHALGVAVDPRAADDYYQICSQILLCKAQLAEAYGYEDVRAVTYLRANPRDELREAVSACGMELVLYQTAAVQDKHAKYADAEAVVNEVFARTVSLQRGHTVYFAMGHYADAQMLGRVVKAVATQRSIYPVRTANAILADSESRYTYPVPSDGMVEGMADAIAPGHIADNTALMDAVEARYIGTPSARYSDNLPGFNDDERGRIDKKGFVKTDGNVAFLTFDDWGSDPTIVSLLDVLAAHDAKGTFFVRTNYVAHNPNLLRAIAAAGHDVGSHTNGHVALATDYEGDMYYESLTIEEADVLRKDVQASWYQLCAIIGDVETDGKPALRKFFRPPTLSVSKEGMDVIFDLGFDYIVSGSFSSHDYEIDDPAKLFAELKQNLKPGAILVLHMSDNSVSTAEALRMLFEDNEKRPESKRYTFARLSDYLDGAYVNP